MGRIFIKGLGAAAVSVMVFFMSFHISSCGGSGSGSTDTSGTRPNPKYTFLIRESVRAGTSISVSCPSCDPAKAIIVGKVPFDIPANTELVVTFPSNPDSTYPGKQ